MSAQRYFREVAALAILAVICLSAAASADSYHRDCQRTGGFLVGNGPHFDWQVRGPYHIDISARTARTIPGRVPPEEFGIRASARKDVPCDVSADIAEQASLSWLHWLGDNGWSHVAGSATPSARDSAATGAPASPVRRRRA